MNGYILNQFFTTQLNVGGGITNSQTTGIVIQSVAGLDITKPGIALLTYADPLDTAVAEWITYTSINGSNELQGVTRGQEGFSAKSHSNEAVVAFPLSESHVNNLTAALAIGGVYTNLVTTTLDEDTMSSNSATALATQQSIKAYVDANSGGDWKNYTAVTPTSGTLDDPSFELTFAGVDLTTTIYPGMRIKLTQGTEKFFIVTKMAFSTNTTMTLYGGTDYDLVSTGTTAVTAFAYSSATAPAGFPMNPDKWTVKTTKTTDTSKASPVQNTWYYSDMGSINISAPIGVWKVIGTIPFSVSKSAAAANIQIALSSSSSSVSDNEMLRCVYGYNRHDGNVTIDKHINMSSKTTYYVIARTTTASVVDITIYPTLCGDLVISLISAYL
jgi:hypothetical protein